MNYPTAVKIIEIAPRDGFQNIKEWMPTELKMEIIDGLVNSNFKEMEMTSFVSPKAIPQMKDAKDITQISLEKYPQLEMNVLVPNLRGAKDAYEAGVRYITYVISASEAHNKANVNRTVDESFEELKKLRAELPELKIKLDLATVFGCPFLGEVPYEKVKYAIDKAIESKIEKICLCDTIGIGNPLQVENILSRVKEEYPDIDFRLHLHDTRGMGLANTLVALEIGITEFETAAGGLGGCPFAPGAAGNLATEDLVFMLDRMNIHTGINLENLLSTVKIIKDKVKNDLTSHMAYVSSLNGVI